MLYSIIVVEKWIGVILVQDVKVEKQKGLGKIINILLNIFIVIFGILLLISIYNNIQINILKNDYSSFFDYSIFEVQTGSMSGEIESGDWVVVKVTKDIELDDIITFKQGDEFTTHRVIEKYNDTYVTKGDVNNSKDQPITDDDIVGKVVKVLVDGFSKKDDHVYSGYTDTNKLVNFTGENIQPGDFVDVLIETGKTFSLDGRVVWYNIEKQ